MDAQEAQKAYQEGYRQAIQDMRATLDSLVDNLGSRTAALATTPPRKPVVLTEETLPQFGEELDTPLEWVREDLGTRACNLLKENGVHTVKDLAWKSEASLRELPSLGPRSIERIKVLLFHYGVEVPDHRP